MKPVTGVPTQHDLDVYGAAPRGGRPRAPRGTAAVELWVMAPRAGATVDAGVAMRRRFG